MWCKNERNPLMWKRENLELVVQKVPFYTKKNFAFLTIGNFIPKWIVPKFYTKVDCPLTLAKNNFIFCHFSHFG